MIGASPHKIGTAGRDAVWQGVGVGVGVGECWGAAGLTSVHGHSKCNLLLVEGTPGPVTTSSSPSCSYSCTEICMTTIFILLDIWPTNKIPSLGGGPRERSHFSPEVSSPRRQVTGTDAGVI